MLDRFWFDTAGKIARSVLPPVPFQTGSAPPRPAPPRSNTAPTPLLPYSPPHPPPAARSGLPACCTACAGRARLYLRRRRTCAFRVTSLEAASARPASRPRLLDAGRLRPHDDGPSGVLPPHRPSRRVCAARAACGRHRPDGRAGSPALAGSFPIDGLMCAAHPIDGLMLSAPATGRVFTGTSRTRSRRSSATPTSPSPTTPTPTPTPTPPSPPATPRRARAGWARSGPAQVAAEPARIGAAPGSSVRVGPAAVRPGPARASSRACRRLADGPGRAGPGRAGPGGCCRLLAAMESGA
jgi:hypothetical protein